MLEIISYGTAGDRPALLFVHGAFHSARCWEHHFLPWFAARGREAHAVSLRGHGRSSGNLRVERPGLADYAADVETAMDRIGRPCVLVGHSMGGVIAQMVRIRRKDAVGAVLYASSPMRPALSVVARILKQRPVDFLRGQVLGDTVAGRRAFTTFFFPPDLPAALRAQYVAELTDESPRALKEVFSRKPPQTPDLETRPVLVIGGEHDWSIPMRDNRRLAKTFRAELKACPGAHDMMLDPRWEASAMAIDAWLDARFAGPAPAAA